MIESNFCRNVSLVAASIFSDRRTDINTIHTIVVINFGKIGKND